MLTERERLMNANSLKWLRAAAYWQRAAILGWTVAIVAVTWLVLR